MSRWNDPQRWQALLDGSGCPICARGRPLDIIARLESSWLTMPEAAPMPGYVCLVSQVHVVELHELEEARAQAFMRDLQRVSKALSRVTGAVKLNYEIHGNTLPHLHMHFFPRYVGDPFEGKAIEPRTVTQPVYAPGQFADVRARLLAALEVRGGPGRSRQGPMVASFDIGVRRGAEVRCPGCTRFIAPDAACPHCLCGPIPPERYGSARELLRSGVDRFALAARTAALEPAQVALLEARYAVQWGGVVRILEEARRVEVRLLQRGFVNELEDSWAAILPVGEAFLQEQLAPVSPLPDSLPYLAEKAPDATLRNMATLAWVHGGRPSASALSLTRVLLHDTGRMAVEAMLALTRWRNGRPSRLESEDRERIRVLATGMLDVPGVGARAAVAWTRVSREEPPEAVSAALHRGLYGDDADVRFECALCLHDEVEVAQALDSPDEDTRYFARRTLAEWGSPRLLARLQQDGDERFAKDVLRALPSPPPEGALEALLTVSARTVGALADELLRFAKERPFRAWGLEDQRRWARWARTVLRELPAPTALDFFEWAATPPPDDKEAPEEEESEAMWAFLEETVQALERAPAKERREAFGDFGFARFLHHAGVDEQRRLNDWARDPDSGEALLGALVSFPGRAQDRFREEQGLRPLTWEERQQSRDPGHPGRLLMAIWEGPGQERLVAPFNRVVRQWGSTSGREQFIEALWRRFRSHPSERGALLTAFERWRDELWERQRAEEPDALARFQTWWRVDPKGLYEQTRILLDDAPLDALAPRLRALWDAAEEQVGARPRTASLSVSRGAMALRNALESDTARFLPELEHFEAWLPAFEQRVRATPSPPEESTSIHRDFLDDTHDALRMMRERRQNLRDAEDRERERAIERAVAESRRRDQLRLAEEARRAEEAREAVRVVEHQQRELSTLLEAQRLLARLQPRVPQKPVDREVIFPDAAFPTLVDYARMMKAMQKGADVMKLFQVLGLTPVTWSAQATAWGQAMVGRLDLGMRFGELLGAPWE